MAGGLDDTFNSTLLLVEAAQKGDRESLEQLFHRYLPRVRRIVSLRLGTQLARFVEEEDIAQEVLLKVFRGLERFEQRSEGTFRNWLSRCVECEIIDQRRKWKSRKRGGGKVGRFADYGRELHLSSFLEASDPSPSAILQARDREEAAEKALLSLPEHHREAIILRYLCEMSYDEVASALGLPSATAARKACSRALQSLRKALAT